MPGKIAALNGRVYWHNVAEADNFIHVIDVSSGKEVYSFGNMGDGPNDFVGAIYIDQGYEQCRKIVEERIIRPYIDLKQIANEEVNFKSRLIEWCQRYRVSYDFVIDKSTHDEHNNPVFHACVMLAGVSAGEGMGYTKKEAQQHAARATACVHRLPRRNGSA